MANVLYLMSLILEILLNLIELWKFFNWELLPPLLPIFDFLQNILE
ncbi:hypothetical protein [Halobacteriovorax marinus]|nr:hypothetical protein [Halobacteriovorax marinus]